jgi:hypothetical protein
LTGKVPSHGYATRSDWDNLLDPERKEIAEASVKSVSELNDLIRGKPLQPDLKVIG